MEVTADLPWAGFLFDCKLMKELRLNIWTWGVQKPMVESMSEVLLPSPVTITAISTYCSVNSRITKYSILGRAAPYWKLVSYGIVVFRVEIMTYAFFQSIKKDIWVFFSLSRKEDICVFFHLKRRKSRCFFHLKSRIFGHFFHIKRKIFGCFSPSKKENI